MKHLIYEITSNMRKRISCIIIFGFFYLTFVSCISRTNDKENSQNEKDVKTIIEKQLRSKQLFDTAIDLQRKNGFFLSTPKDTLVFINSAVLMEEAISLDNSNRSLYVNLAKVYLKLDSTEKSIQVLDDLLKIDSNYVEAISARGFMYEKMGEKEKAFNNYKKALDVYSLRLNKEYGDYINRTFLIMLLYGEKPALEELQEVKKKYPKKDISFLENQFRNFDRGEFIKNGLR